MATLSLSGLQAIGAQGISLGQIADLQGAGAVSNLRLSADRKRLLLALGRQDPARGFGSDIWSVNLDGSDARTLRAHEANGVYYASPTLDRTGGVLYASRRTALIESGAYKGARDEIVRIDLRSGASSVVVSDGGDLDLAPDGSYLAYIHFTNGTSDGLWRVNTDGTDARPLLRTRDRWSFQQSPRFSPDGRTIAFCAAGRTTASTSGGRLAALAPAVDRRLAHLGIPSDLVLIDAAGTSVRELAKTTDDTVPAWSPEGSEIAYVVGATLKVVVVASGAVRDVAKREDFSFGEIAWVRR